VLPASLTLPRRVVGRFAEFGEERADTVCGAPVAVGFAVPATFGQLLLKAEAFAQTRSVLERGDELGAGQVEVGPSWGRRRQWPSSSSVL
jgi:hypothetical protein